MFTYSNAAAIANGNLYCNLLHTGTNAWISASQGHCSSSMPASNDLDLYTSCDTFLYGTRSDRFGLCYMEHTAKKGNCVKFSNDAFATYRVNAGTRQLIQNNAVVDLKELYTDLGLGICLTYLAEINVKTNVGDIVHTDKCAEQCSLSVHKIYGKCKNY